MIFNFNRPDICDKIKNLPTEKTIEVSVGTDHVDLYAKSYYLDYSYWIPLCIYNNLMDPFNLVDQGITKVKFFNKSDYIELTRKFK